MSSRYDRGLWARRRRSPGTTVEVADRIALGVPVTLVWSRLQDLEAVASSIPGLVPGSLERDGAGAFRGTVRQVALGVTAVWALRSEMRLSEPDRRLDVRLEGEEPRLGMTLAGSAAVRIVEGEGGTELDYVGHVEVRGRLAAAGAPIIHDMVDAILRRFVATMGGAEPAAPDRGGRLTRLLSALRRLRRRAASPG